MLKRSKVRIEETSEQYSVFLDENEEQLFEIQKEDRLSLKMAIVSMVNSGLATQVELAKIFHLRRETIANYVKAYKKSGISGLGDLRMGSHGIPDAVENRIVELLRSATTKKVEIPQIIQREFGKSISRTKIYGIRKKHLSVIQECQSQKGDEKKK